MNLLDQEPEAHELVKCGKFVMETESYILKKVKTEQFSNLKQINRLSLSTNEIYKDSSYKEVMICPKKPPRHNGKLAMEAGPFIIQYRQECIMRFKDYF